MYKDKELKAIKVIDAESGEILAIIEKSSNVVCKNGYNVILDYSKEDEMTITEIDGKFYELGFVKDKIDKKED